MFNTSAETFRVIHSSVALLGLDHVERLIARAAREAARLTAIYALYCAKEGGFIDVGDCSRLPEYEPLRDATFARIQPAADGLIEGLRELFPDPIYQGRMWPDLATSSERDAWNREVMKRSGLLLYDVLVNNTFTSYKLRAFAQQRAQALCGTQLQDL